MTRCSITIFEGPDGAGKTTLASEYAKRTGARYVHFGVFPDVGRALPRLYVEAMTPALYGYQPVVMDRCWLSEEPYADVYRNGVRRFDWVTVRMLERLAMRCGAVVVKCLPPVDACIKSFYARRNSEYMDDEASHRMVHEWYGSMRTALPVVAYDYTAAGADIGAVMADVAKARFPSHLLSIASSGNLLANVLVIGSAFASHKNTDPLYQWSFASFSGQGCSRWLTEQLEANHIDEDQLLFCNADQPLDVLAAMIPARTSAMTLGSVDARWPGQPQRGFPHPQFWRRFHHGEPYPLIDALKEALL